MKVAEVRSLALELRSLGATLKDEAQDESVGAVLVSGVLAEQLAKELRAGAEPGSVLQGGPELLGRADVAVRVIAGEPTAEDDAFVRTSQSGDVPVVLVQLWPQPDWTRPFVLTPFVVECRAGEGFPVQEIAGRIVEASDHAAVLAARIPSLVDAAQDGSVLEAVVRSALIGLAGPRLGISRRLLTLEQIRLLSRLRTTTGATVDEEPRSRAAAAAAVFGTGYALRTVARSLRGVVPAPIANAAVAAAGTWAIAKVVEIVDERTRL